MADTADTPDTAATHGRSGSELDRVLDLVEPIAADLDLDVYDVERRGATIRVTLDTPPGSDGGITLDNLSLATRLISREIDHEDPVSGRFTLEVSSPGLERQLRTPAHFQREVGKTASVRLRDPNEDPRRIEGVLAEADDRSVTLLLDDGTERTLAYAEIDKARTVFVWAATPKQGGKHGKKQPSAGKQNSGKQGSGKHGSGKQGSGKHGSGKQGAADNDDQREPAAGETGAEPPHSDRTNDDEMETQTS